MKRLKYWLTDAKYWFLDVKDILCAMWEYYTNKEVRNTHDSWREAISAKIKYTCGGYLDPAKIPHKTPYCYNSRGCCPYYLHLNQGLRCCKFIGFIGFSPSLWDQCKICDVGWPKEMTED